MANESPYRGVLLDLDGTLVDSNDAHARAWHEALAENGHDLPYEKIRRLIGMGGDNLLPAAIGVDKESEIGKKISERRGQIFKERYLPHLRPFPEARDLVKRMRDDGLHPAVATSAPEDEAHALIEIAGIADLLEERTSADDAESSKPDPDIIHAALDRLGLPKEEVLLLGDTPYDIAAAHKAGIGTIAFRCGGFSDQDLAGAIAIYDGPADLLARYEESPLAAAHAGVLKNF